MKAQDLVDLQQYLAGLYSGLYSVKSIDVDGVGGGPSLALAGTIALYARFTGTTTPTPALNLGVLTRAGVPIGWATVGAAGDLLRGLNVLGITHPAAGRYLIVFNVAPVDQNYGVAFVTGRNLGNPFSFGAVTYPDGGGTIGVHVEAWDQTGHSADTPFSVILYSE